MLIFKKPFIGLQLRYIRNFTNTQTTNNFFNMLIFKNLETFTTRIFSKCISFKIQAKRTSHQINSYFRTTYSDKTPCDSYKISTFI